MSIFDADGHITETQDQIAKYLDDPYRRRAVTYGGLNPADGWDRRMLGTLGERGGDAPSWLAAMDRGGVEQTVLYPTLGLFMSFVRDREWQVQICRAYNRMLHEEFITQSPRLHAVALLPILDVDAAASELRNAVTSYGCVGAMLAADGGHLLGDRRFDPIYAEAQSLGVMLGIHASGSHLGGAGVDGFPSFIQTHTCSHAFGQMRQLTSTIFDGVFERFPTVRVAFLEAGCGWAPYWTERMDDEYAKRHAEAPACTKKPSEYVRSGRIYFSCEADEWMMPQAMKLIGNDQIVWASDYPHWDHSFPGSIAEIRERGDLTDAQKQKILNDNARRLYGVK
jgi:predicted TIM-barrel fold metal-dependent hydrolase